MTQFRGGECKKTGMFRIHAGKYSMELQLDSWLIQTISIVYKRNIELYEVDKNLKAFVDHFICQVQ